MRTGKFRRVALIKAVLLLIFIVAAVVTVRFTGVREFLTVEKLGTLLAAAGIWGPLAFILIYAVGVCLFIPGTLLTALGAAIFGPY
ncbi:MAG: TVP38/TMEM64 family protein, partial [Desulfobaccales bacterium]